MAKQETKEEEELGKQLGPGGGPGRRYPVNKSGDVFSKE